MKTYLLLLLCVLSTKAFAQEASVTGKLIDGKTDQPIEYAGIILADKADSLKKIGVVSNAKGEFNFLRVASGDYNIRISLMGYNTILKTITVNGKSINLGIIKLTEDAIALKDVSVNGKYATATIKKDTVEFNADAYKTQPNAAVEDLLKKYQMEFQFFKILNEIEVVERTNYQVVTQLRIKNTEGKYILLQHRLVYLASNNDGSVWLSLCLYNLINEHLEFTIPQSVIINTLTGKVIEHDEQKIKHIITEREREILQLIKLGYRSKEIAEKFSLSINTINRHRQNIFYKLNVTNALEACKVAETMGLL
ncbi:MAG: hypothetical protein EOO96_27200 [Pedobacter sp.]|nr:MAG: hypothetical protein EOO96_27200 [Pedobacter sp.]